MAIVISSQAYSNLWDEANAAPQHIDPLDQLDVSWSFPPTLGKGFVREIELREGLELQVMDYQLHNGLRRKFDEHEHPIQCGFLLASNFQIKNKEEVVTPGHY